MRTDGVQNACVKRHNQLALQALQPKPNVVVVDAYAAVMRVCGEGFQTCSLQHEHDVHPSGPGKMFLALEVAAAVAPLLGPAK